MFVGPKLLKILVIFFEQVGDVESVGAFALALVAMHTLFDDFHLFRPFLCEIDAQRRATQEKAHTVAVVDLDAHGTRHAIAAAATEITGECLPLLLHLFPTCGGHLGGIVLIGDELVQFTFPLDAPDGKGVVVLIQEGVGQGGVVDQATGQCLHADKAHVVFAGSFHNGGIFVGRQIGKRILQGIVDPFLNRLHGHMLTVVADTDEPHLPLPLGNLHGVIQPHLVTRFGTIAGIMELIDVKVIRLQIVQGSVEILPKLLHRSGTRLGGNHDLVAAMRESLADLHLAVRIEPCGIVKINAIVVGFVQQIHRLAEANPLNGQGPKAILVDFQPRVSYRYLFHKATICPKYKKNYHYFCNMKKILILNGPNLNLLGRREPEIYGYVSFETYFQSLKKAFPAIQLDYCQSNHEGVLIDTLQAADNDYDGVVLNPGGYAHTSIALADCIRAIGVPVVEVHISDISKREPYRQHSFTAEACRTCIMGKGLEGYALAVRELLGV